MKRIYNFNSFLNEKKETKKTKEQIKKEVERDVKKVATEMFDKTKNIQFEYKDDLPKTITFEVSKKDFNLNYENEPAMFIEYSQNVLSKREYKVGLVFSKKEEQKESDKVTKYIITFNVKLTATNRNEK